MTEHRNPRRLPQAQRQPDTWRTQISNSTLRSITSLTSHSAVTTKVVGRSRSPFRPTNVGFEVYVTPYSGTQISDQQFHLDEPSGVVRDRSGTIVDGVQATTFYGSNPEIGDTREVWFIHGGFLYEVTTYKELDAWLQPILQSWQFI
jgi:hypothetical protein